MGNFGDWFGGTRTLRVRVAPHEVGYVGMSRSDCRPNQPPHFPYFYKSPPSHIVESEFYLDEDFL